MRRRPLDVPRPDGSGWWVLLAGGTVTSHTVTSFVGAAGRAEPVTASITADSGSAVERSTVRTVLRAVGMAAGQLAVSVRTARAAWRTSDFGPFYAP